MVIKQVIRPTFNLFQARPRISFHTRLSHVIFFFYDCMDTIFFIWVPYNRMFLLKFSLGFIICEILDTYMYVSILVGVLVFVDQACWTCYVLFTGYQTQVDQVILNMVDFDIILGISWLSSYHVFLHYHARTTTIAMPRMDILDLDTN